MDLMTALTIAIPMIAGWRFFGREFWPQFLYAVALTTYLQSRVFEQHQGEPPGGWTLAIFAGLAAFQALLIYGVDKRFKLSHWEKNPE